MRKRLQKKRYPGMAAVAAKIGVSLNEVARLWLEEARYDDVGMGTMKITFVKHGRLGSARVDGEWVKYAREHFAQNARRLCEENRYMGIGWVWVSSDALDALGYKRVDTPAEIWDVYREGDRYVRHINREAVKAWRERLAERGGWCVWSRTRYAHNSEQVFAIVPKR